MKTPILCALIMVSLFSCRFRDDVAAGKEKLRNIILDYYNALAKKDLEKMNSLTTSNFILFDEGNISNNESALKSVEKIGSFTASFRLDSLHTHMDKANASAYYFREAAFTINDSVYAPVKFLESATFEKKEGEWKLRFLHSSIRK